MTTRWRLGGDVGNRTAVGLALRREGTRRYGKIWGDTERANKHLGRVSIDEGVLVSPSGGEAAMDIKANKCAGFCIDAACAGTALVRHRSGYGSGAFERIDRYIGRGLSKSRKARD